MYFTGMVPGFAAPASALPQLCIAALMALAVWVPFACGQLSLAQAGFMALGAYGSAWLTVHEGWTECKRHFGERRFFALTTRARKEHHFVIEVID